MTEPYNELANAMEEEARKAKWQKVWGQFGIYLILLVVFVLGGAAFWSIQQNRALKQSIVYSNAYEDARTLFYKGDHGLAIQKLQEIVKKGPVNYRTMARFILIDYYQSMSNFSEMKKVYEDIFKDSKAPDFYTELARVNLIRFQLDHENPTDEQMHTFLATLSNLYNANVKKLATEIEGFIYYQLKNYAKSREIYTHLAQMQDIDHDMRTRAQSMIRLIYMKTSQGN